MYIASILVTEYRIPSYRTHKKTKGPKLGKLSRVYRTSSKVDEEMRDEEIHV